MSAQSHYVLNVAQVTSTKAWDSTAQAPVYTSTHFCRIDLGPVRDSALIRARDIQARFPSGDLPGHFRLQLTYWKCAGESVAFD